MIFPGIIRWRVVLVHQPQPAKDRYVNVPAADQPGAIESAGAGQCADRPSAGVGKRRMAHACFRHRAGADHPVLGLKMYLHTPRNVVRYQGRDTNAEIDKHSQAELARNPLGNPILCVQRIHVFDTK
jgi:hypothetical protein